MSLFTRIVVMKTDVGVCGFGVQLICLTRPDSYRDYRIKELTKYAFLIQQIP